MTPAVGDTIPAREFPVTRGDLVRYAGASGDFNPIHWNERVATEVGLPGVIAHGMFTVATAIRIVTDWAGDPAAVVEYGVRFTRPVLVPDPGRATITVGGEIRRVLDDDLVEISLTATVDGETVLAKARAVVRTGECAVKIHRVMDHDLTAAQVYEMSTLEAFQEQKCRDAGALKWTIDITTDGDTAVVRTRRTLPTVGFPTILRKLVPSGVTSTETITWGEADADGGRVADLHVDLHGAPARMNGTITLEPTDGGGARITVDAEFKALLPVIGGKVEKVAAPIIIGVIESEERTGLAWAADSV